MAERYTRKGFEEWANTRPEPPAWGPFCPWPRQHRITRQSVVRVSEAEEGWNVHQRRHAGQTGYVVDFTLDGGGVQIMFGYTDRVWFAREQLTALPDEVQKPNPLARLGTWTNPSMDDERWMGWRNG